MIKSRHDLIDLMPCLDKLPSLRAQNRQYNACFEHVKSLKECKMGAALQRGESEAHSAGTSVLGSTSCWAC